MEDIESNATAELRKIPKEAFRQCIHQWQDRWSKSVCAQGSDFEGDWVSVVIYPTITVLYHNSGNFVTAPRNNPVYISVLTGLFALLTLLTVRYIKHATFPDLSASLVSCVFEFQVL